MRVTVVKDTRCQALRRRLRILPQVQGRRTFNQIAPTAVKQSLANPRKFCQVAGVVLWVCLTLGLISSACCHQQYRSFSTLQEAA